ncbi:MAG: hypothetical protein GX493_06285 [Firmicutes bacterium]|nr:hypothetical protein [Bacillota bacterium]
MESGFIVGGPPASLLFPGQGLTEESHFERTYTVLGQVATETRRAAGLPARTVTCNIRSPGQHPRLCSISEGHIWTGHEVRTAKPIKEIILQTNAHALGSQVFLSTDGGASWRSISSSELDRPLPVEGNPHRVMLRIDNIPRFPAGEYIYHLQAVPAEEPPPLPAGSNVVTFTYEYDACGNRVLTTANGISETYEYHPQSDRLYRHIFPYDPNGNLILKETPEAVWRYEYDYANRLVAGYRASREGGEAGPEVEVKRYTYDFSGLRLTAISHGVTTEYLYLGNDIIWENRGGEVRNYIWALGKHLARVDGTIGDPTSRVYWYHTDHLGTVQVVTDAEGRVVWRNEYRAFGEQLGPRSRRLRTVIASRGRTGMRR